MKKKRKKSRREYREASRKYKENHPWRYAFNYHKQNARRRLSCLPRPNRWTLSFDEFMSIWDAEPKKKNEKEKAIKGSSSEVCPWEIDRIDASKGYEVGNVRLVTKRVNLGLYWMYKRGEIDSDWIQTFKQTPEEIEKNLRELRDECPF